MKKSRRKFSPKFKAKVAIEALKERESLAELSKRFDVHPTVISKWKQAFLENSSSVFEKDNKEDEQHLDPEKLYAKIGKLELENDRPATRFLKKSLGKLDL